MFHEYRSVIKEADRVSLREPNSEASSPSIEISRHSTLRLFVEYLDQRLPSATPTTARLLSDLANGPAMCTFVDQHF